MASATIIDWWDGDFGFSQLNGCNDNFARKMSSDCTKIIKIIITKNFFKCLNSKNTQCVSNWWILLHQVKKYMLRRSKICFCCSNRSIYLSAYRYLKCSLKITTTISLIYLWNLEKVKIYPNKWKEVLYFL